MFRTARFEAREVAACAAKDGKSCCCKGASPGELNKQMTLV